jgi:hypothetical protein
VRNGRLDRHRLRRRAEDHPPLLLDWTLAALM